MLALVVALYYTFCSDSHHPVLRLFEEAYTLKGSATSMIRSQSDSPQTAHTETDTTPDPITMYTTTWCGDCRRAKRIFADFGVAYVEVNIESDEDAAELVETLNDGLRSVPTIVFPDGGILVEPSNTALMAKLQHYIPTDR